MDTSRKISGVKAVTRSPMVTPIVRGIETNRDIAARDIAAAQATLAAIVEYSDDAIMSSTLDGIVQTWNRGAEHIFGYTAAEIIGQPHNMMIPPDRQDEVPRILDLLKKEQRADHFETTRIAKSGRNVDVAVTISPIKDATGQMTAFSTSTRDITSLKNTQRELNFAKESAEAANKAKDHFLSVLSHELRTPLTPVLAEISFLETQASLPPEFLQHIGMIRRNLELEARLVDDLLDLTRIRRQNISLHFEVVDVHQLLRNALEMVQNVIDTKWIDAAIALRAHRRYVWGDPDRLQQVFMNMLSNAAKFTPQKGLITVRTSNAANGRLRIEVGDNGIGIEPDMILRLFNAFEQTDRTRRFGGLGLGLSIAKSLIELHGGTITATSAGPNLGAMFAVELDTVAPVEPVVPTAATTEAGATGCRVLFVEDHSDTRNVMERLLKHLGCSVMSAGGVQEALALAEKQQFDLLITDLGLPDGSGTQIMENFKLNKSIRGIAISGLGQEEDLQRSREAGFEMHLIKPINFPTLKEAVLRMSA
ncbi:MAG: PAS domain S-box protein [Tepidisphaeraceae bacterium]|jgi:PAS domain S-box-containing protein